MNIGRTVFAQLMDHLPRYEFQKCVTRYRGNYQQKSFSCWDQFLAMAFAQLMHAKLYHMGFRGKVARSTLADANESRDWQIYADFAQVLIRIARPLYAHDPIGVELDRWAVELFFRWIKQNLRIKSFYGTSENAVKTQIWIAVSVYVLVAIVRKRLGVEASLYQILQIFSVTLFEKVPILWALEAIDSQDDFVGDANQMILFDF